MHICYSDEPTRPSRPVPYHRQNAVRAWLRHYENMLLLDWLAKNETDARQRVRAREELEMAHRKLDHWARHANYDQAAATAGAERLKAQWARPAPRSTGGQRA